MIGAVLGLKKLTLQSHGGRPTVLLQRLGPERDVAEVDPGSGVVDGEPELVHGLEALGDVVEDVVGAVHDVEVGLRVLANVALERAVVESVQVLEERGVTFIRKMPWPR